MVRHVATHHKFTRGKYVPEEGAGALENGG